MRVVLEYDADDKAVVTLTRLEDELQQTAKDLVRSGLVLLLARVEAVAKAKAAEQA